MTGSNNTPRPNKTICIYFCQDSYENIVNDPIVFRVYITDMSRRYPEIFPDQIHSGFQMKDQRVSNKLDIVTRRITIHGIHYSLRPSFVIPYMTGYTADVEKALFLRKFAKIIRHKVEKLRLKLTTLIAKIALEENDDTRWLAILLGPNPNGNSDLN